MSLNTVPRTWLAGEVVTASQLNAEIRDAIAGIESAWTAYTPAWAAGAGTPPAIGNGSIIGRYQRIGKSVALRIFLQAGSTTTHGAGAQSFTLPFPAAASGEQGFTVKMFTGPANYVGFAYTPPSGTTLIPYLPGSSAASNLGNLSASSPNPGTVGNLSVFGTYEIA